ncbi:MAG: glycogen debranching N-terminal domain-containing protein [Acidimicrobiia bacterium]
MEPVPGRDTQCQLVTVSDRSFCCADGAGDVMGSGPQGFFHHDTRYASQLVLEVDGRQPESVSVTQPTADSITVVYRDPAATDGVSITRRRIQGTHLEERLRVENHSSARWKGTLGLVVGSDFAHVLDVRLGDRQTGRHVDATPTGDGVMFVSSGRVHRAAVFAAQPVGNFVDGRLHWSVDVPRGSVWEVVVTVVPHVDHGPVGRTRPRPHASRPRLSTSREPLQGIWDRAVEDLDMLTIDVDGRWCFAAGVPWFVTLFGRDAAITALETLPLDLERSLSTAEALASLQGVSSVPARSEEPGKILHELREGDRALDEGRCYYGSVDATPLFCVLVGALYQWGADPDRLRSLLPAVRNAVGWLDHRRAVGEGLVTYGAEGARLANEGWKDSVGSIVDGRGEALPPPIALVEAQGYAVAAYEAAALLESALGESSTVGRLAASASELRDRLETEFWLPRLGTYAMAVNGAGQVADVVSTNPGHLLWLGVTPAHRVRTMADTLVGPELWTGFGLRCLGRSNPAFDPWSYHRGSVWPHDSAIVAAGLARYGLHDGAARLIDSLLSAASYFGYRLPEVFAGEPGADGAPSALEVSSSPQAWSAGVAPLLVATLLGLKPDVPAATVNVDPFLGAEHRLTLEAVRMGSTTLSVEVADGEVLRLEAPGLAPRRDASHTQGESDL